uniref:Uncharacterized protein n=1 Tax=Arundo donax TaxID=35708 RepID=A0A0A9A8K8_ARUDO
MLRETITPRQNQGAKPQQSEPNEIGREIEVPWVAMSARRGRSHGGGRWPAAGKERARDLE